jgi:hypothetical protein
VQINDKNYPINEWVENPFGGDYIKFVKNPHYEASFQKDESFNFTFIHPKVVSAGIYSNLYVGSSSKLSTVVRMTYEDSKTTEWNRLGFN